MFNYVMKICVNTLLHYILNHLLLNYHYLKNCIFVNGFVIDFILTLDELN
jgi:hypothetical protein